MMVTNRSAPPTTVTPVLFYPDVREAVAWLEAAFGFGERVRIDVPRTIADGLQAEIPGEMTFEVNRRVVDEVVTVSDAQIVEAMRFLFERMKVVVGLRT